MDRSETERGIDLTQLWGIFYLRWRIIGAIFVAALVIAVITQILRTSPLDQAATEIVVPIPVPETYTASSVYAVIPVIGDDDAAATGEAIRLSQALTQTYRYALTTLSVRQSLVEILGLGMSPWEVPDHVEITVEPGTQFITVTGTMDTAGDAIAVANGYADALSASDAYSSVVLGNLRVNLEIVERAEVASRVVSPSDPVTPVIVTSTSRVVSVVLMFGAIGLFIGLLAALFVEWADGRANWPAQVSARTGLPSIGSVRDQRRTEPGIEPFRAAKARINGALPRGPHGRSLLITSAHTGEGKTTVVSNMALALAEDGSSVVIVSADVRSATAIEANWPGLDDRNGLSEYLNDPSVSLDDILSETPEPGISIVTRGRSPDMVVPRVDSERMNELVHGLSERADWVLFDGAAALESADAARLGPLVDGTVLVVDGRHTTLSSAESATDVLSSAGATIIGFFHNRTRGNPVARMLHQELA
ncbi:MAG: hypothetical protein IIC30_05130 [Chloroflexi bacterium]|nr:hypothetical protein [Chloroflexota bacterium]